MQPINNCWVLCPCVVRHHQPGWALTGWVVGIQKMHVQNKAIIYSLMPPLLALRGAASAAINAAALTLFILILLFILSTCAPPVT